MTDVTDIVEDIRAVLEANLADPWETATGDTRTSYVFTNDIRLSGDFPKVLIKPQMGSIEKLSWGGKTSYKQKVRGTVLIIYYNRRAFTYETGGITYSDGGSNTSQSLNQYMLKQICDTLKTNAGSIAASQIRFGTISETSVDGDVFWGFVPISFQWVEG